jgi:hypothetical protein
MVFKTKTQALEALRGMAAQAPVSSADLPSPETTAPMRPNRLGRPPAAEETLQISLRLPRAWHTALRHRAVEASIAEERTISPQEIVRRLVGQGLGFSG